MLKPFPASMSLRFSLLALVVLTGCGTVPGAPHSGVPAPDRPIQFLLVNDVYVGDTALDGLGGIARLTTLKKQLARNGPVLLFVAGDFISPSLLSKWYYGKQMIQFLNSAGADFATTGNHEFSFDRPTLEARIRESKFKWVNSNCFPPTPSSPANYSRWDTLTIQGTRFGIFGLTVVGPYPRFACEDPDISAHAVVRELKSAGAEVIFGLTHLDRAQDSAILANETDVDLILGGHEHSAQEVTIGDRFILKADQNARSAQLLTLHRKDGRMTRTHKLIKIDRTIASDPVTQNLVDGWQDTLRRRLGPVRVIGTSRDSLDARNSKVRKGETNFGNLVADALRIGTKSDIALIPGGTMRLDDFFEPGPVTNWKIESVFLFATETRIVSFQLTGQRLRELIEHSLSHGTPAGMTVGWGGWLQVSGLRYQWQPRNPVGSRVVGDVVRESDGRPVTPGEIVRVAMSDYQTCDAGDGYVIPEATRACAARSMAPRAADLIMRLITEQPGGIVPKPTVGRITQLR